MLHCKVSTSVRNLHDNRTCTLIEAGCRVARLAEYWVEDEPCSCIAQSEEYTRTKLEVLALLALQAAVVACRSAKALIPAKVLAPAMVLRPPQRRVAGRASAASRTADRASAVIQAAVGVGATGGGATDRPTVVCWRPPGGRCQGRTQCAAPRCYWSGRRGCEKVSSY